jgi:hypothetical protein
MRCTAMSHRTAPRRGNMQWMENPTVPHVGTKERGLMAATLSGSFVEPEQSTKHDLHTYVG